MSIANALLTAVKELLKIQTYQDTKKDVGSSILGKTALDVLIDQGVVKCPHLNWTPETSDNDWRSSCVKCGLPAQGSCQG